MLNLSSMETTEDGDEGGSDGFVTARNSLPSEDYVTIDDYTYAMAKNNTTFLDEVWMKADLNYIKLILIFLSTHMRIHIFPMEVIIN